MKEITLSKQFPNFSKNSIKLESIFNEYINHEHYSQEFQKDLIEFRNELYADISKIFAEMNVVVNSNIDRKNKINILKTIKLNANNLFLFSKIALCSNNIDNNLTMYYYKAFEVGQPIFKLIFLEGLPYIECMINSKFKRSLKLIEPQEN